jgi:CheY-like chemotaxis protein
MPRVILAVEDHEPSREVLAIYLRHLGYEVIEAATCAQALDLVLTNPDLILLDLELPDGNGWNLAAAIQTQFPDDGIPIVVISSRDMPATPPVQVAAYLQKPTDLGVLVGLIHSLIGPPEPEAGITA